MQRQFLAAAILVALAACSTTAPPEAADADASASIAVGASPAPPPPPVAAAEAATLDTVSVAAPRMAARMIAPMPTAPAGFAPAENTERYERREDNPVHRTREQPVSTFSIDVDTGSYANVRRMLRQGVRPPADAVRAEEFINYFDYGHPAPTSRETPFRVTTELAPAPWNAKRQLLMIGIRGYDVPWYHVGFYAGLVAALCTAFLGLGFLISALSRSTEVALGASLGSNETTPWPSAGPLTFTNTSPSRLATYSIRVVLP